MAIENSLKRQGIDILQREQNSLDGAFEKQSKEVAPSEYSYEKIEQNTDGTWTKTKVVPKEKIYDESVVDQKEAELKSDAEVLQELCRRVDNKIIEINNNINIKKEQIVDLSTTATNGNCWPGIAYSSTQLSSVRAAGAGTISSVTSTTFNNDIERVKTYVPMAGPGFNPGASNPFDPDTIVTLSSSNSGYGYKNLADPVQFKNNSNVATGSTADGSGSNIGIARFDISTTVADHQGPRLIASVGVSTGYWYAGAGVAPDASDTNVTDSQCVGIANSITAIYTEIIELRKERDSLRGSLNGVKDKKKEKELGHWGYQNMKNEVNVRKTSNASAISAIEKLDTNEEIEVEEGLQMYLDASINSSYYGSGDIWYDLSDRGDSDADIEPDAATGPQFVQGLLETGNYFSFDGIDDHVDFDAGNIDGNTTTVTVEILARLKPNFGFLSNNNGDPSFPGSGVNMIFGFDVYDVIFGGTVAVGSTVSVQGLGFNTGNGEIYGIDGNQFESLGLNNNWKHYVFEMRSDVSYTNNKIYIDAVQQVGLSSVRPQGTVENAANRVFNGGLGRIAGWQQNNQYRARMDVAMFRIYNKALTQQEVLDNYNEVKDRFS